MLDGQVGDAAARIEPVGRDDGARGADVEAAVAIAAVARFGRIGRQRDIDQDLAQEEHRAAVAVEQQRMLAAPAESALAGQRHFHHRRRIGKDAVAELADLGLDPAGQLLQTAAQDLVIVAAARVQRHHRDGRIAQPRQFAPAPVGRARRGLGGGDIGHARHDGAYRARHQFGRPGAPQAVVRHIIHVAVVTLLQPCQKPRLGVAKIDVGDAHRRKTQRGTPCADGLCKRRQLPRAGLAGLPWSVCGNTVRAWRAGRRLDCWVDHP
ncbi:hypothetical protein D9M69_536810 [compost metagenome]